MCVLPKPPPPHTVFPSHPHPGVLLSHLLPLLELGDLLSSRGLCPTGSQLVLHLAHPASELLVGGLEFGGQLPCLLQRAQGFGAGGRDVGVARLDSVQLLLDQQHLLP